MKIVNMFKNRKVEKCIEKALLATDLDNNEGNLTILKENAMLLSNGNSKKIDMYCPGEFSVYGTKGLYLLLDCTFEQFKIKNHNNIFNAVDNTIAYINYSLAKYGKIVLSNGEEAKINFQQHDKEGKDAQSKFYNLKYYENEIYANK